MGDPIQLALMLGPLSVYFYVLGVWQSGRRPRVVSGMADHALLAFGLSGLIVVGPAGRAMLSLLFGPPRPWVWMIWTLFAGLWGGFFVISAAGRIVVYKVEEAALKQALEAILERWGRGWRPALDGFESAEEGAALRLHPHSFLKVGVIQATGRNAEDVATRLRADLVAEFEPVRGAGPNFVTWGLFLFSWIAMLAPLLTLLLNDPEGRAMIREFLDRVPGRN